jgi:hypothetical protein
MGETVEVELVEDQGRSPSFGGGWRRRKPGPRALYGFRVRDTMDRAAVLLFCYSGRYRRRERRLA